MSENEATERRRAEEAIAAAYLKLQNAFENLPLMGFRVSPEGRIINCNQAAAKVLGYNNKKQLAHKPFVSTVFAPHSREKARKLIFQCSKLGRVRDEEMRVTNKSGGEIEVLASAMTMGEGKSKACYQVWLATQLHAPAAAEKAWVESEETYRKLLKMLPEAVVFYDAEGKVMEVSQQAVKMYGAKDEREIIGTSAFEMIAPEDREKAKQNIRKSLAKGFVRNRKYRFRRKDGTTFAGGLSASVVKDIFGKPKAFIAIIREARRK